jgi:hypothetical protein
MKLMCDWKKDERFDISAIEKKTSWRRKFFRIAHLYTLTKMISLYHVWDDLINGTHTN